MVRKLLVWYPGAIRHPPSTKRSRRREVRWGAAVLWRVSRVVFAWALAGLAVSAADLRPLELRCEYRQDPLGIDEPQPRLSWGLAPGAPEARGLKQSGYQVLVASSPERLARAEGDWWNSGQVASDEQIQIAYAGKPLPSRARCYWKVRVWDQQGRPSHWSEVATWTMGLLDPRDWQARWIAASDQVEAAPASRITGYHALEARRADELKWVQVDLGQERSIDGVVLYPPTPPGFAQVKGFGFPVRFRIEASNDPQCGSSQLLADHTAEDFPNPGDQPASFTAKGITARYVRVTATRLWNRASGTEPFCFALAELAVLSHGANLALHAPASAKDSIERADWNLRGLNDGIRPTFTQTGPSDRPERTAAEREGKGAGESDQPPYAAVLLRKEIDLPKRPMRATAYVCGLGYFEFLINQHRVGDHVLDPGFTDYTRRVLYLAYDVTSQLQQGRNAIAVTLGGGWYDSPALDVWSFHTAPWIAPPKLLLRIEVEFSDGTQEAIVSDATWKRATGPLVFNSVRGGETYDARREKSGWEQPGYDDSAWPHAQIAPAPAGRLTAQSHPPIRVVDSLRPVALSQPKPGVYVFDLGVNIAGWARLTTRGQRGQRVTLQFNELTNQDGTVNVEHLAGLTQGRFQTDEFILKGEGVEAYEPRFTYHGFRYVQVTGLTEKPTRESLTGRWVHTDPEPAGEFACSNPLVNRIHEMIRRTQLNNLHGIPTDCPQREKIGWAEDGCVTMEEAIYNFGMATFYTNWQRDMLDAQDANGHAACIAPSPGWGKANPDGSPPSLSDPWWGGAIVRLPWQIYRYYGDRRILGESYPALTNYLNYVGSHAPDHIPWADEGDWLEVGSGGPSQRTPPKLAAAAAYAYYCWLAAQVAGELGRQEDSLRYAALGVAITESFNRRYFDGTTGRYAPDSQTAAALALCVRLIPESNQTLVLDQFLRNIRETRTNHISSGIVGTHYVFQALMNARRNDVAYTLLTREGFPGWEYMLRHGASTIWEAWDGSGSRNHPALGSVDAWLYQALGGIRLDETVPAFKRIRLEPAVVGDLKWVKCAYRSTQGKIETYWRREGGRLRLEIAIPPNTTAAVVVPNPRPDTVTESGLRATAMKGVKFVGFQDNASVFEVGSGRYVFETPLPASAPPGK